MLSFTIPSAQPCLVLRLCSGSESDTQQQQQHWLGSHLALGCAAKVLGGRKRVCA